MLHNPQGIPFDDSCITGKLVSATKIKNKFLAKLIHDQKCTPKLSLENLLQNDCLRPLNKGQRK